LGCSANFTFPSISSELLIRASLQLRTGQLIKQSAFNDSMEVCLHTHKHYAKKYHWFPAPNTHHFLLISFEMSSNCFFKVLNCWLALYSSWSWWVIFSSIVFICQFEFSSSDCFSSYSSNSSIFKFAMLSRRVFSSRPFMKCSVATSWSLSTTTMSWLLM